MRRRSRVLRPVTIHGGPGRAELDRDAAARAAAGAGDDGDAILQRPFPFFGVHAISFGARVDSLAQEPRDAQAGMLARST